MNTSVQISREQIENLYQKLKKEAEASGYFLNPDAAFSKELAEGLLVNENRYGYQACPCRLAAGKKDEDLDIICPCDYRDSDIADFGACYCALYVSRAVAEGEQAAESIPERRPTQEDRRSRLSSGQSIVTSSLSYPVWRCRVCGYLCARDNAPDICPICKAKKERFEKFLE